MSGSSRLAGTTLTPLLYDLVSLTVGCAPFCSACTMGCPAFSGLRFSRPLTRRAVNSCTRCGLRVVSGNRARNEFCVDCRIIRCSAHADVVAPPVEDLLSATHRLIHRGPAEYHAGQMKSVEHA